jgi:hypothetical protein
LLYAFALGLGIGLAGASAAVTAAVWIARAPPAEARLKTCGEYRV